jgi:hypothetical protein
VLLRLEGNGSEHRTVHARTRDDQGRPPAHPSSHRGRSPRRCSSNADATSNAVGTPAPEKQVSTITYNWLAPDWACRVLHVSTRGKTARTV